MVQAVFAEEKPYNTYSLPITKGSVEGKIVDVLRDTECNTAVIRRSLVAEKKRMGALLPIYLINHSYIFSKKPKFRRAHLSSPAG